MDRVECQTAGVARRGHRTLAARVLAVVEDGTEGQHRATVERGRWRRDEHAIRQLVSDGFALGPARAEDDRHPDRPGRAEAVGVQHPDWRTLPLDGVAGEQALYGQHVLAYERPRQRLLAEREPPGEPGSDRHVHAPRCELHKRPDRRRGHHRVTQ